MPAALSNNRDRMTSAFGVALIHALLGYALIAGLGVSLPQEATETLKLFAPVTIPPPPPERIEPERKRSPRKEGAASPANLRATPTQIVAPPPVIPLPPPPVVAAPVAAEGAAPDAGAAPIPGPGTGAGGYGTGRGSGNGGDGTGGGGGGSPPRKIKGRITFKDYPDGPAAAGISGTVWVRYHVAVTGRVDDCRIIRTSGTRELDDTTCRLIRERFRFKPGTDENGRPVPTIIEEDHYWIIAPLEDEYALQTELITPERAPPRRADPQQNAQILLLPAPHRASAANNSGGP